MFAPISIFVHGDPKGQPRPRAFARGGMVRMYDPATAEGWKSAIADEWRRSVRPMPKIETPVSLSLHFAMPRPKSHSNKKGLKADAPIWHAKKPDADNMAKAVMDALTQLGVWQDDDQVVVLQAEKKFANSDEQAGCEIILCEPTEE